MSLQAKFLVLLAMLGFTVLASVGAALFSFDLYEAQVVDPFDENTRFLSQVGQLKSEVIKAERALEEDNAIAFSKAIGDIGKQIERLETVPRPTTTLRAHFELATVHGERYLQSSEDAERETALAALANVMTWARISDDGVLQNAKLLTQHAANVQARLVAFLSAAIATAIMVSLLALILIRRWVTKPVADLRTAAVRIAEGDFEHRVKIKGTDEMAMLGTEVNQMAGMVFDLQEERVEKERLAAAGELVRRLAHNLRNPLAGIRAMAELTRSELATEEEELRENQRRIIVSVDRFERWLAEMLAATKPLKLSRNRCDIKPWLTGVVEAHQTQARAKQVALSLDASGAPDAASIDARNLEHSVVVIVSNAIEATPSGSRVHVSAATCPEDDVWEIRVADQGTGVPEDLRDRIFKPYFTTKRDGNGIGLAFALQILEGHGGTVAVADEDPANGTGATFILRLPLDRNETATRNASLNGN